MDAKKRTTVRKFHTVISVLLVLVLSVTLFALGEPRKITEPETVAAAVETTTTTSATTVSKWCDWIRTTDGKRIQYSTYGPYEGETMSAVGVAIGNRHIVAVPYQLIVSHRTWKAHNSRRYRMKHFFYGEILQIRRKGVIVKAKVMDCGGFLGYGGQYYRLFDLTPGVFNALGVGKGTGLIYGWRYLKGQ